MGSEDAIDVSKDAEEDDSENKSVNGVNSKFEFPMRYKSV